MAAFDVKLPEIGEGVNEGEIVRWLVKEGDVIKHDQPIVEVMTDKATVEIPCSSEGKVVKILAKEGQIVKVGESIISMDGAAAQAAPSHHKPAPAPAPAPQKAPAPMMASAPAPAPTRSAPTQSGGLEVYPPTPGANVLATPGTRRYAREAGVDLNRISGSGPLGRITRDDVAKASQQGMGAATAGRPEFTMPAPTFVPMTPQSGEERKPLRGIRRKIAENLVRAKQIIPHFTHGDEADVTELVLWRNRLKEDAQKRGVKLTYLPFVMKALAITCREFTNFNASIDDAASEMVFKHYFNIGFAADTPEGLLVPVVKNVESKSILQIANDIQVLAEKAKTGKLSPDEMRGGTITVTNIGSVGGIYATPIINHPEVAIIGIYKIQKKPVFEGEKVVGRDFMTVTATCDHRIIDGAQAARFLNKLIARLQNPQSLLLEMI